VTSIIAGLIEGCENGEIVQLSEAAPFPPNVTRRMRNSSFYIVVDVYISNVAFIKEFQKSVYFPKRAKSVPIFQRLKTKRQEFVSMYVAVCINMILFT
jgi:hypothetical protein